MAETERKDLEHKDLKLAVDVIVALIKRLPPRLMLADGRALDKTSTKIAGGDTYKRGGDRGDAVTEDAFKHQVIVVSSGTATNAKPIMLLTYVNPSRMVQRFREGDKRLVDVAGGLTVDIKTTSKGMKTLLCTLGDTITLQEGMAPEDVQLVVNFLNAAVDKHESAVQAEKDRIAAEVKAVAKEVRGVLQKL